MHRGRTEGRHDLAASAVDDVEHAGAPPASRNNWASRVAESGDFWAGFSTTELPIASAGATFQALISSG